MFSSELAWSEKSKIYEYKYCKCNTLLQGDSGGPLIYNNNNTEPSTFIGIVSTIIKPGDWPNIFTEDGEYVSYEVIYLSLLGITFARYQDTITFLDLHENLLLHELG